MIGGRSMPEKCRRSSKPSCASMLFSLRCQQAASTRVDMLFFSASDFNRTELGICDTLWRRFRKLFQKVQRRDQFVYCRQAPKPANTHHKVIRLYSKQHSRQITKGTQDNMTLKQAVVFTVITIGHFHLLQLKQNLWRGFGDSFMRNCKNENFLTIKKREGCQSLLPIIILMLNESNATLFSVFLKCCLPSCQNSTAGLASQN